MSDSVDIGTERVEVVNIIFSGNTRTSDDLLRKLTSPIKQATTMAELEYLCKAVGEARLNKEQLFSHICASPSLSVEKKEADLASLHVPIPVKVHVEVTDNFFKELKAGIHTNGMKKVKLGLNVGANGENLQFSGGEVNNLYYFDVRGIKPFYSEDGEHEGEVSVGLKTSRFNRVLHHRGKELRHDFEVSYAQAHTEYSYNMQFRNVENAETAPDWMLAEGHPHLFSAVNHTYSTSHTRTHTQVAGLGGDVFHFKQTYFGNWYFEHHAMPETSKVRVSARGGVLLPLFGSPSHSIDRFSLGGNFEPLAAFKGFKEQGINRRVHSTGHGAQDSDRQAATTDFGGEAFWSVSLEYRQNLMKWTLGDLDWTSYIQAGNVIPRWKKKGRAPNGDPSQRKSIDTHVKEITNLALDKFRLSAGTGIQFKPSFVPFLVLEASYTEALLSQPKDLLCPITAGIVFDM